MAAPKASLCSFCGKPQDRRRKLIAGPGQGVHICEECVKVCGSMLAGENHADKEQRAVKLTVPRPHEIKEFLDGYVIGHDHVKKVLSVAVHNHYKRLKQGTHFDESDPHADVEIEKSNILMIGPTGCGKTLLARTLARLLDVPFTIADATTLTEAGYVGEDVENILLGLIQNAEGDVARAEMGIIYIDEIDKVGRKTDNVSITRDVSGEGVQQALLKILDGTEARVPPGGGRKHPQQEYIKINTNHILFICGGAFVGLEDIVKRRAGSRSLGFLGVDADVDEGRDEETASMEVEPEDLVKFGLIPEFVGRLPVAATLGDLTEDDLVRILVEPRNCMVRQYQKLLAMEGIALTFTDAALKELARQAIQRKSGARGLRSILERLMLEVMFEAPRRGRKGEIRVSKAMASRKKILSESIAEALKIA